MYVAYLECLDTSSWFPCETLPSRHFFLRKRFLGHPSSWGTWASAEPSNTQGWIQEPQNQLPSLKLTFIAPEKWWVSNRNFRDSRGPPFSGAFAVSFRECINGILTLLRGLTNGLIAGVRTLKTIKYGKVIVLGMNYLSTPAWDL